jgi:hypothetical protein
MYVSNLAGWQAAQRIRPQLRLFRDAVSTAMVSSDAADIKPQNQLFATISRQG